MKRLTTTRTSDAPAAPPLRAKDGAEHRGERERCGAAHEHEEPKEERRLGEASERRLARAAHPLEGRAGVERGADGEEAAEAEQVREEDEVARERDRRAVIAQRNDERRDERGRRVLTTGPARKTHVVVVLKTDPLRTSLARS